MLSIRPETAIPISYLPRSDVVAVDVIGAEGRLNTRLSGRS